MNKNSLFTLISIQIARTTEPDTIGINYSKISSELRKEFFIKKNTISLSKHGCRMGCSIRCSTSVY